jgi:asparagine synthase (glutamine-hydrolysing)
MCGIAGMVHPSAAVDAGRVQAMADAIAHRGPDGSGLWRSPDGRVVLAHRRLSILDISAAAAQPMRTADGAVVVSFNGEIYNHAVLRRELESAGYRFVSDHSDTEVLLHGFRAWGIDGLLSRLSGMFAFALWDQERRRLHLVRDRIGIKPLYFARLAGGLAFASEIKALLTHPGLRRAVCRPALWHTLSFLTPPAPLTLFDGVFKLPAGWRLEVGEDGVLSAERWWRPQASPWTGGDPVAALRRRLDSAVESHMAADVPVGAFLSGGVDSSTLVALMSRLGGGRVSTFTVGFSDHTHLNELTWADSVARTFGTDHHVVTIAGSDMEGYLDELIHSQDEPIADWVCIPLHFVSRQVRQAGVKVVLVGEGADELFCGYPSWVRWLGLHRRFWSPWRAVLPQPMRRLAADLAGVAARARPKWGAHADLLSRAADPAGELFWSGAIAMWEGQKRGLVHDPAAFAGSSAAGDLAGLGLLPAGFLQPDGAAVARALLAGDGGDQLARMTRGDLSLRLPELLLMRVDKITMAQSIEARVPFLDRDLVEFALGLPSGVKLAGGPKGILKQAVRGLVPDAVIDRPKHGFGAPMSDWLRGEFGRRACSEIVASPLMAQLGFDVGAIRAMAEDHRAGRRDASLPLWVLYNITAWHRRWME